MPPSAASGASGANRTPNVPTSARQQQQQQVADASSTDANDAAAASAASSPASSPPPPPPPRSFVCRVSIPAARYLFSVDERDDPDAAARALLAGAKKKASGGPAGSGTGVGANPAKPGTPDLAPPRSALASAKGGKKSKRGTDDGDGIEAPHFPLHTFVTFVPFEPVLVPPPPAPLSPSPADAAAAKLASPDKRAAAGAAAGKKNKEEPIDEGPPPPVFNYTVQTPVAPAEDASTGAVVAGAAGNNTAAAPPAVSSSNNGSNPSYRFEHTQRLLSPENFLDRIWQSPLVLTVWQYIPVPNDGKKKKPAAGGGAAGKDATSGGSGAGAAPPGSSHGSRKKKLTGKKGAAEEEEDPRPFGDLDPEQVVKLGEVHVPLANAFLEQGSTRVSGWFPLLVADETLATARALATQRGRPLSIPAADLTSPSSSSSVSRPELQVEVEIDQVLVDAQEARADNRLTISVSRVERMPSWIVDVAQLEAVEQVKRSQAAKAEEAAAAALAASAAADPNAPGFALPLSGLASPPQGGSSSRESAAASNARKSSATGTTGAGGGRRGGKGSSGGGAGDEPNPLDDFPEKDYTDSFSLKYNLALGPGAEQTVSVVPPPAVAAIGYSEQERTERFGAQLVPEWVAPLREVPRVDDTPLSPKDAKSKQAAAVAAAAAAANAGKRSSSGRNTPVLDLPSAGEARDVQYLPPVEFNPAVSRGALLFEHSRSAYLSSASTADFRAGIERGQRFLMSLEHTRTPHDEKALEAGKTIVQRALALVDLRPLLKPGVRELSGAFVVRQISAPLPVPVADEGKKGAKRPPAPAAGNRRATSTGDASAAAGADALAAPVPPETFDEAHTFIVVNFRLERPLVARRAALSVQDVLPVAQQAPRVQSRVADSFLSAGVGAHAPQPQELLADPQRIVRAAPSPNDANAANSVAVVPAATSADDASSSLARFRAEVSSLVAEFLSEYEHSELTSGASTDAVSTSVTSPSVSLTARVAHALPAPRSSSSRPSLAPSLASSGLSARALSRLAPRLCALLEARFFIPAQEFSDSNALSALDSARAHKKNELYAELAREVGKILRSRVSTGGDAESDTDALSAIPPALRSRVRFDNLSQLASHAELAGALSLAARHHTSRLTEVLALFTDAQHSFPASSPFALGDIVSAWYEYGAFLMRRQNGGGGVEGLTAGEDGAAAMLTVRKIGSIDGGESAAIDLAEECLKQCLRYNPSFVPALLNLTLINLEQNEVEHSVDFLLRALAALPSHPLILAVQGLYHEMAEEDEQAAGAFHRAGETLNELLQAQQAMPGEGAQGTDVLMHVLLGAHGVGAPSLPLLHSQSVGLLLARYLASQGFRSLAKRVLDREVAAVEWHISQQPAASQNGGAGVLAPGQGEVCQFGPFLELAQWHSAQRSPFASVIDPLLQRARSLIEQRPVDLHHSHSLLYAFGTQASVLYDNRRFDEAAQSFQMYLTLVDDKNMRIFVDPVVVCRASSLFLLRHALRSSVSLATLLCTHPLHTHSPFHWALLGQTLAAAGRHGAADEALAEALAKDEGCGAAWGARAQAQLLRLQADERASRAYANSRPGRSADAAATSDSLATDGPAYAEAHHAFDRALSLGCEDRHTWLELGRLWHRAGAGWRAEQAYARALVLSIASGADAAFVREKLSWLEAERRGGAESEELRRESDAAVAIQRHVRGAMARKQRRQQHSRAQLAEQEARQRAQQEQRF